MKLKGLRKLSSALLVALMLLVTPVSLPATNPQVLANTVKTNTALELPSKFEQLPARFSWVDYKVVTTPKQQEPYGLCWDFASIGALESQIAIHFQQSVDLSEAALFKNVFKNINALLSSTTSLKDAANGGNNVRSGAEALIRYGVPFENCYPYTTENIEGNNSFAHCPIVYRGEVIRFVAKTESATNGDMENIKRALVEHGPLLTRILDTPYRPTSTVIAATTAKIRHEVLLVGWDDNLGAWQIKNSFGPNWGWTKDGLAYLKYGALEVSEVYYLTATAFDPADVVVAGDNGTAVGNDTLMGTNQAQIAMQWTVTTPVYLKSVEFWTPAPNLHYTAYLYKGSVTNHDAMPLAVKKINTQETGYYVIPMDNILLNPGTWNIQIKGNTSVIATTGRADLFPNLQVSPNTTFFRSSDNANWTDAITRNYGIPIRIRLNTGSNTPQPQPQPQPEPVNISVTASPSEGGYIQITPTAPYISGQTVRLKAVPNKGYHFVGWSINDSNNPDLTITLKETTTITAIFAPNVFSIKLSDNIGTNYSEKATFGETLAIPLKSSEDLVIEKILVNGKPLTNTSTVVVLTNIDQDYSIEVTYKQVRHISMKVGSPQMFVNGKTVSLDAPPVIVNSRTLVPLRAIAEALGADVNWNPDTRQVTVKIDDKTILLTIGNPKASVNGQTVYIDPQNPQVVPIISNSRTMVPLRFIAETMGATVEWDPVLKNIYISYEEEP